MVFRLIKRLIGLIIIAAIVFIALSLWQGGNPFRWFGKKSERAGEVIKKKSEEVGEEADKIKKKTDGIKSTTKKVSEGIKKTGEKIKEITGSKSKSED
jgi:predicted  nucleic acid-binding Zn-ribbon protein